MNLFSINSSVFNFTKQTIPKLFYFAFLSLVIYSCSHKRTFEKTPKVEVLQTPEYYHTQGSAEYSVYFENFPKHEELILKTSRIIQKKPGVFINAETLTLDDNNFITLKGRKGKILLYSLNSTCYAPGERVKIRFSDTEGNLIAQTSYFPKPIHTKSQNETFSLSAELACVIPETYLLTLNGIAPGEKVHLHSTSADEVIDSDFTHEATLLYMPGVIGHKGGHGIVEITRENGDKACLSLQYGEELAHEILKDFEVKAKKYPLRVPLIKDIS